MFSKRSIERLAGAFMAGSIVAFLGHFVALAAGSDHALVLCLLIYGFLIILSAMTLYLTFRSHERTLAMFGAFGLAAHGLFLVLACAVILGQLKFAQQFVATAEADTVVAAATALEVIGHPIRYSAFIFQGLALVSLGALIVWSRVVARWLGWFGVVGGILGFLGALAGLFNVVVGSLLFMSAICLMFGFMLILGVRLLVWETREATAA